MPIPFEMEFEAVSDKVSYELPSYVFMVYLSILFFIHFYSKALSISKLVEKKTLYWLEYSTETSYLLIHIVNRLD